MMLIYNITNSSTIDFSIVFPFLNFQTRRVNNQTKYFHLSTPFAD
jgi:hypothetical protein